MRAAVSLIAVLLAGAGWSSGVLAQTHDSSPMWGKPQFDDPDDIEDPEEWKESASRLPPYPKDSDLVDINLPTRGDAYDTFLDASNLAVGEDYVVRYTVVLRSRRGASNVLVEGLRCATREYRSYGIGVDGRLEPTPGRPWRPIGQPSGGFAYRLAMSEKYACKYDRNPFPKDVILKRIDGQRGGSESFLIDDY